MSLDLIRCPGCGVVMDLSSFEERPGQVICPRCKTQSIVPPRIVEPVSSVSEKDGGDSGFDAESDAEVEGADVSYEEEPPRSGEESLKSGQQAIEDGPFEAERNFAADGPIEAERQLSAEEPFEAERQISADAPSGSEYSSESEEPGQPGPSAEDMPFPEEQTPLDEEAFDEALEGDVESNIGDHVAENAERETAAASQEYRGAHTGESVQQGDLDRAKHMTTDGARELEGQEAQRGAHAMRESDKEGFGSSAETTADTADSAIGESDERMAEPESQAPASAVYNKHISKNANLRSEYPTEILGQQDDSGQLASAQTTQPFSQSSYQRSDTQPMAAVSSAPTASIGAVGAASSAPDQSQTAKMPAVGQTSASQLGSASGQPASTARQRAAEGGADVTPRPRRRVLPIDSGGNTEALAFAVIGLIAAFFAFPPVGLPLCITALAMNAEEKRNGFKNAHAHSTAVVAVIGIVVNCIVLLFAVLLFIALFVGLSHSAKTI